jgi:hypothetical protein
MVAILPVKEPHRPTKLARLEARGAFSVPASCFSLEIFTNSSQLPVLPFREGAGDLLVLCTICPVLPWLILSLYVMTELTTPT